MLLGVSWEPKKIFYGRDPIWAPDGIWRSRSYDNLHGRTIFGRWHTSKSEGKVTIIWFLPVENETAPLRHPTLEVAKWSPVIDMLRSLN